MKNRIMKLAQALSLLALVGFGSSAHADIITISFDETAPAQGTYEWKGFVFTGINSIASANCDAGKCINLAAGANSVKLEYMPDSERLSFDLLQFYYGLTNTTLTVVCEDDLTDTKCADLDPAVSFTSPSANSPVKGTATNDGNFGGALSSILSVTFSKTQTGRISLDTFKMSYTPPVDDPCIANPNLPECGGTTVPEPGTLGLLGLGLLGLAVRRRRKV